MKYIFNILLYIYIYKSFLERRNKIKKILEIPYSILFSPCLIMLLPKKLSVSSK